MRLRRMALAPRLDQVAILRQIIGHIDGEPVYAICGADGEGDDNGGDGANKDSGKDGSKGGSGNDDSDDDDDDDAKPPKDPKEYKAWHENRKLRDEAARRRVKAREATEKAEALQKELDEIKKKDMSELEKAQAESAKLQKTTEEQSQRIEDMQIKLAFLEMPRDKFDWHDPGAALTLLVAEHRSTLTLNEDGTVDGLDQAVKALAKKHKFLLRAPGGNGGGDGDGKDGSTGGSFGNNGDRGGDSRKAFQQKAVSRFKLN